MKETAEEKLNEAQPADRRERIDAETMEEIRREDEVTTNKVLTVPNILSLIRLLMIPLIVWVYVGKKDYLLALVLIVVSFATDVVDGWIARRFNMISRVGKLLDPAADKFTQAAVLGCLMTRFPHMVYPFVFIFIKDLTILGLGYLMYRKTKVIAGAKWYGKLSTGILYGTFVLHLAWIGIPATVSDILIVICLVSMAVAFVLYLIRIFRIWREETKGK